MWRTILYSRDSRLRVLGAPVARQMIQLNSQNVYLLSISRSVKMAKVIIFPVGIALIR